MTTKRKAMSRPTEFLALKLMETIIDVDGDYCRYKDDWTDAKVAASFVDIKPNQISRLRCDVFGKLRDHKPRADDVDQMATILERLRSVEARLTAIERKQPGHPYANFDTQHELSLLRSNGSQQG